MGIYRYLPVYSWSIYRYTPAPNYIHSRTASMPHTWTRPRADDSPPAERGSIACARRCSAKAYTLSSMVSRMMNLHN